MRVFRRRAATPNAHYKGVPVVDLLAVDSHKPMRFFGAEGPLMWARLGLLVAVVAGGVLYYYANQGAGEYAGLEATALQRASTASALIDEALSLQDEIETLEAQGNRSQLDLAILRGEPGALVAAIESVIAIESPGVTVLSIESLPPNEVTVQLEATTHGDAIAWRRELGFAEGVERVVSFESIGDDPIVYELQLISGGE